MSKSLQGLISPNDRHLWAIKAPQPGHGIHRYRLAKSFGTFQAPFWVLQETPKGASGNPKGFPRDPKMVPPPGEK